MIQNPDLDYYKYKHINDNNNNSNHIYPLQHSLPTNEIYILTKELALESLNTLFLFFNF